MTFVSFKSEEMCDEIVETFKGIYRATLYASELYSTLWNIKTWQ